MLVEEAAHRLHIPAAKLLSWEDGSQYPTVKQLRRAANLYKQSFAAFYLPKAPEVFRPALHDYRRLPGADEPRISSELSLDIRLATDRRDVCLELLSEVGESPPPFEVTASLRREPESLARSIRELIGVTMSKQRGWSDRRIAFNRWRELLEDVGILVFQSTRVPLEEMRGYSLSEFPLPAIVVNRKDTHSGRIFTMLHEFTHLLLRSGGVCDLVTRPNIHSREQRIEVFCNHVAGAALVPKRRLLNHPSVDAHAGVTWDEEVLESLARYFQVSREVVLRRLLVIGRTTQEFYEERRRVYRSQYERRQKEKPRGEGGPSPSVDVVSAAGKPFVRAVLGAYYADKLTTSDVSDFLEVKMRHLQPIGEAVGIE